MRCLSCGAQVPDGALTCPSCRSSLDVTRKISISDATWCPSCGALVAPGASECPKCGASLVADDPLTARSVRDLDLPEIGNTGVMDALSEEGRTGVMTRIESAIPPVDDASLPTRRVDRMPRTRALALAGLLALVVVGGAALLITHPWDPEANRISATTPADTSMQGFPGLLESLTGQDKQTGQGSETQSSAELLVQYHGKLGDLSERADASEESLGDVGLTGSADERAQGLEDVRALSIEVSNLIESIGGLESSDNADEVQHLLTLGNWLRNRCDALEDGWSRSAEADRPADERDSILADVSASAEYASFFSENYDDWAPAA